MALSTSKPFAVAVGSVSRSQKRIFYECYRERFISNQPSTKIKKWSGIRVGFFFPILLLSAAARLSQNQPNAPTPPFERAVEWVDIHLPTFPPRARQARIRGTVTIEVRFKG